METNLEEVKRKLELELIKTKKIIKDIMDNKTKIISVVTFINIINYETIIEIGGIYNINDIIRILYYLIPCSFNTYKIIGETGGHIYKRIENISITEALTLDDGIEKIREYIKKNEPEKIRIYFPDFDNSIYPDFIINIINSLHPSMSIEISSTVGTSRFNVKNNDKNSFRLIKSFYKINSEMHTFL